MTSLLDMLKETDLRLNFTDALRSPTAYETQVKSPSSSEVAAMIEGVIRHCTEMSIDRQYVDSHGQSEVAFAFCHLGV